MKVLRAVLRFFGEAMKYHADRPHAVEEFYVSRHDRRHR